MVFDDVACGGSYIEDKGTGERISLEDRGGMYMLKQWVRHSNTSFYRGGEPEKSARKARVE